MSEESRRPKMADKWTFYTTDNGMEWAEPPTDDCPICVCRRPHRHNLREDGTFGVIVEMVEMRMVDKMKAGGWIDQ